MATEQIELKRCDLRIFRSGQIICFARGEPPDIEHWVKWVATRSHANVDWYRTHGSGAVMHLGDKESHQRVMNAICELAGMFKGKLLDTDGISPFEPSKRN